MTVLTPKSGGNLLQESIRNGDMNPVISGMLKMVGYKVQIITFSQILLDTYQANYVRCPNLLMVKGTDVVYIALLKTFSLCTFVANKSQRSTEAVFLHFLIFCLQ